MPRAIEAIKKHGLTVPMITTELRAASDPAAKPTLATAAKLGVSYWKPGYLKHNLARFESGMYEARAALTGLTALAKEHGVAAGYHNHSGNYFGAAVWDTREAIANLDPKWMGYYFDPGHATIEGGLAGWSISLAMVLPRMKMVALKDFIWAKDNTGKWRVQWCPMGEGMVDWKAMFAAFKQSGFTGPLTLHIEYGHDELDAIAKDCEFVKKQIAAAYGS
jgi:sugar phosphate isomerase/epimerase